MAIIAFTGYAGSGKNTAADIAQRYIASKSSLYRLRLWQQVAFAGPVKEIAAKMLNVPVSYVFSSQFKIETLGPEWGNMTGREFLQKLGTDAIRNGLHKDAWVNVTMAKYKREVNKGGGMFTEPNDFLYPNWLITDMRFPNELAAVKKVEGHVIRVWRVESKFLKGATEVSTFTPDSPELRTQYFDLNDKRHRDLAYGEYAKNAHESETSLDSYPADYNINNNGTLSDLEQNLITILNEINAKTPIY